MTSSNNFYPLITLASEDIQLFMNLLKSEGISASCQDINTNSEYSAPGGRISLCRIDVAQEDLIKAVDILYHIGEKLKIRGNRSTNILIPIDFSDKSMTSCRVGFELAERLEGRAHLLHAVIQPKYERSRADYLRMSTKGRPEVETLESAGIRLDKFSKEIKLHQREGLIPPVYFEAKVATGLPEECILSEAKEFKPKLIVMATRSSHKKAEELVGSVTAEVLDACRTPLFTVPENYKCPGIRNITRLIFFINGSSDIDAMERFLALFDFPQLHITLIPVSERGAGKSIKEYVEMLRSDFNKRYSDSQFDSFIPSKDNIEEDLRSFIDDNEIQLLIVQNKKRNIFSRLINPGIAHILLYERDMPMIILPV